MYPPKYYQEPYFHSSEGLGRAQERMLAEFFRQRQGALFNGGYHPAFEGRREQLPPSLSSHGSGPVIGAHLRHSYPSPMSTVPGVHIGLGMSMSPHVGMGIGIGMVPGRQPFGHSLSRRDSLLGRERYSPFGFGSPCPPQAHSFPPCNHHAPSAFSRPYHSPFMSSRMTFDDLENNRCVPSRHYAGRQMRGGYKFASQYPSMRSGLQSGLFEDFEDDFDECEDYDNSFEYEDEDEFEGHCFRRPLCLRWRGGY
jgi:hypothetical protein